MTTRTTLHCLMLVLALGSLTIYVVDTVRNAGEQDAFVFVVVPLVSWVLMVVVLTIAALFGRRAICRSALNAAYRSVLGDRIVKRPSRGFAGLALDPKSDAQGIVDELIRG